MSLYSAQRTIFGISLQLAMLSGREYRIKPNSLVTDWIKAQNTNALNDGEEAVEGQDDLVTTTYPKIMYVMFGEGGRGSLSANDKQGFPYTQHSPTDGIPFKPVRIDDATADPTHRPESYLLRLEDDQIAYDGSFYQVNKKKDVYTVDLFNDESKFLAPTPVDKNNLIISDNCSFILCNLKIKLVIDGAVLKNLVAGGTRNITEIAICTGLDNYKFVQVAYHVDMTIDLETALNTTGRVDRVIEVGGQCPLLQ